MDLKFTNNELENEINALNNIGEVMFVSKAADVEESAFDNVIQIIDEAGNEVNCTIDKFIEIFDNQGLEGFIL
ncbi:hypothetical protein J6N69_03400 [bacterium]|nr:hypothetical protein [bacterium]MBP3847177.1 hypothetical protein [bacterium]